MELKPITISFSQSNSDVANMLIKKKENKRFNEMNKKHEGNSSFVLLNYKEISLEEYNIAKKQI